MDATRPARRAPVHGVANLKLTIETTAAKRPRRTHYRVRLTPAGPGQLRTVRLLKLVGATETLSGESYDVTETPEGWKCDCPDFEYTREGRDPAGCKHIASLHGVGLF